MGDSAAFLAFSKLITEDAKTPNQVRSERDSALARLRELEAEVAAKDAKIAELQMDADRAAEVKAAEHRTAVRFGAEVSGWERFNKAYSAALKQGTLGHPMVQRTLSKLRNEATGWGGDGG